ncbi:Sugar phosphate permease [Halobiforma haloterrestris]|uniref:Sugar phosphate permease n=1 Tax=Natronobacterium haloterrestre TaxID=148448 RepID=A0A1I1GZN4_NATHA|nr:MFS transporter [Halobiforma haloterrestris]SFC16975.1 Sugar phosphate permease [Halobiforma haloterrestris]
MSTPIPTHVADRARRLRRLGAELWSEGRGPILVAVAGGWFLSLGVRMIYPAVLPQLRAAYGLDLTRSGLLITALWVAYALGQLPGGVLDDRIGGGRVLVASTGVSAVALTFVVVAGSVPVLFAATILFGFATALYGVARFTILTTNYPDHGGTAIGLTMAAGDLGNTLLPPLAGALAVALAWELGFAAAIPLFLLATVGIHLTVPGDGASGGSASPSNGSGPGFLETLRRIGGALRGRAVLTVAGIQTLGYCVWQAFTGFYPTYLVEAKGIAPTTATVLFGGFFALGTLVKPLAGSAYDARGLRRSLPVVLLAITAAMALLPLVEGLAALTAITALASGVLGYGTITLTYLTNALPEDVQGTGLGSLRTGYMLIGAGSPTVVGALADAGYFDEAFLLLAAVAGVALALSLSVPSTGSA